MRYDSMISEKNNDTEVDIREAAPSDAAGILEVQKLAFHGQALLYDDFTLPPLVQTLEELVRDFTTHVILKAIRKGKIVGTVRGHAEGATCHISRLSVHPDHQGRGIGKKLMLAIEEKFSGAARYELFTGHKSKKSFVLYGKLGYRMFMEKPQSDKVTLICMEKMRPEAGCR